jgi:putative DNA primase/helicase
VSAKDETDRAIELIQADQRERDSADPMPGEPWTELGYAHRLIRVYGGRLRHVPEWKCWLVWDGTRWARDVTGQAHRWAKVIARRLTSDAYAIVDENERKAAVRLARQGERNSSVNGALNLASTEEAVAVTVEQLDADPFVVNCANGTLDLRTLELRPHDPGDLLTKVAGASRWDRPVTNACTSEGRIAAIGRSPRAG